MDTESISHKPGLDEWLKLNPGRTLNDYYTIYGAETIDAYSTPNVKYPESENVHKEKKGNYGLYIGLGIFCLIAFFTNPQREEHQEALRIRLGGIVEEMITEKSSNVISIGLGKVIGNAIIDEALKNVSTDNYLLFSVTKFNFASDSKTIGFGCLGQVYLTDKINKESVKELVKKLIESYK